MPLHLIKLCVGCDSLEDLVDWIAYRLEEARRTGLQPEYAHVTRMVPKRASELVDGGSLYWVIKGNVQCRQRIVAVDPFTDSEGVGRCRFVLDPAAVATAWQPRRAFQGWRYLADKDAPRDLRAGRKGQLSLPPSLRQELAELGLL